jgi:type IV pilus assembly protein PilV
MRASAGKLPRDSRGFTLIEVLMALLILTVGLLGLLQSVNIAYEHTLRNRLRDEAAAIAEEQLNVMRLNPSLDSFTTANNAIGGRVKPFRVSRMSERIRESGSRKLTVTVRWSFKNMTVVHEIYTIRRL